MKLKKWKRKAAMGLAVLTGASCVNFSNVFTTKADNQIEANQPRLIAVYDTPAKNWNDNSVEPMPLGNGFIGAMVYGGVESDQIVINEHTLWSGGPGAEGIYTGGIDGNPIEKQAALQKLRNSLQYKMTYFSEHYLPVVDEVTGNIRAYNYPDLTGGNLNTNAIESDSEASWMKSLFGKKENFGSYQQLSNIIIDDLSQASSKIKRIETNAESDEGSDQTTANLFDSDERSKWYQGEGTAKDTNRYILWEYNEPVMADSYTLISGNDEPSRDPKSWVLYGSKNGTDFVKLDERNSITFPNRTMSKKFTIKESSEYKVFKLEILEIAGDNTEGRCQISEIKINTGVGDGQDGYSNYERKLDLDNALAEVLYTKEGVSYKREYFVSYPGNIMVIRLTADQPGSLSKDISLTTPQEQAVITSENDTITLTGRPTGHTENGLKYAQQVKVIANGGETSASNGRISVTGADSILILMSAGTNYVLATDGNFDSFINQSINPLEGVKDRIAEALGKTYDELYSVHKDDYDKLFTANQINLCNAQFPENKTTVELLNGYAKTNSSDEDRYLEMLYYQFGRYLLIASSRPGTLPANLQGIWAIGLNPPWDADYHTNINLQMNYWLAEMTNLSECHMPVIDYFTALAPYGVAAAQMYYCTEEGEPVRGFTIHHENNIWGYTAPGTSDASYFPEGAAWMCQDIWEHYAYTLDAEFLAEYFDIMLDVALFWVDNLWEDKRDGTLVANPSYSPEHGAFSLGCTSDQGIIWELFDEVIKAADVLNIKTSEIEEIKTAQSKLYSPTNNFEKAIGVWGQFKEWKDDVYIEASGDSGHRHTNQLFALHPGTQVVAGRSLEDDILVEAMKQTLELRGDGGTGWSMAWKINFWARLRDGNRSQKLLKELITNCTYDNLFDAHSPFQIDGNFGGTSGMAEMLLQSQGDSIDLLPALPEVWHTGSYTGLVARGSFLVSAKWSNKTADQFEIISNKGGSCTLNYGKISEASITDSNGNAVSFEIIDADLIRFDSKEGETYFIQDIPKEQKRSQETSFIRAKVDNIYSKSIKNITGWMEEDGVYIKNIGTDSMASMLGFAAKDVIVELNGMAVTDTKVLNEIYKVIEDNKLITAKVWRINEYIEITFEKSKVLDSIVLPGKIEAENLDAMNPFDVVKINNCAEGGSNLGNTLTGYVQYDNIYFTEIPLIMAIRTSGTNAVRITARLDDPYNGVIIADITAKPTGNWDVYDTCIGDILNVDQITDEPHTLYLNVDSGMNLNWFAFYDTNELPVEEVYDPTVIIPVASINNGNDDTDTVTNQDVEQNETTEDNQVTDAPDNNSEVKEADNSGVEDDKGSNTIVIVIIVIVVIALGTGVAVVITKKKNKR